MDSRTTTALERVPVTVIGGYLGAGKTTLVNRLLTGNHGRRLAVLVNDFGEVNIDADLIAAHDGRTISLTNGCVCCSIVDALGDGLDRVLAMEPRPDQIVIEASGVADPGKVAAYGQGWPGCRLDGIVVLADAETIRTMADDGFVGQVVLQQLRRADLVVVTKCDLVDDTAVAAVTEWISGIGGGPVVATIGRNGGDDSGVVDLLAPNDIADDHPIGGGPPAGGGLDPADRLFSSTTVDLAEPLDRGALERALESWPDSIVRVKGLVDLAVRGDGHRRHRPHVVHRVGRRWSIEPADATGADNEDQDGLDQGSASPGARSRLVVISVGRPPHPARLRDDLLGPH